MKIILFRNVLENVKAVYFAEDGKLDITFTDGKEAITINPYCVKEILND